MTQEVTVTSIISTQSRLSVHFDSWEEQECKIDAKGQLISKCIFGIYN